MSKTIEPWFKIPRDILNLSQENELAMPVFVYICAHRSWENRAYGSTHEMAYYCGLASSGRSSKFLDQCLSALEILKRERYLADFSQPGYICRKHEHRFEVEEAKFDVDENYAKVEFREINALLAHRYSPNRTQDCSVSYTKMLRVLSFIRLHQSTAQEDDSELIFSLLQIERIACDLGIAYSTALNAVTVLRNQCIIDYQPYRVRGWDQTWKTVASIFIPNQATDNSELFDKITRHLKLSNQYK